MKTTTLLVLVAVAFMTVQADQQGFEPRVGMIMFLSKAFRISLLDTEKCVNKTGASIDDLAQLEQDVNEATYDCTKASTRRMTCAMVCCAHIQGSMVNGTINMPFVNNLITESGMPESALAVLVPIFHWCHDRVKLLTDACDVGCIFLECMVANTKYIGM
ncbi:uncharacterized protein LOC105663672 [Megachile rotundata]|uniref:uncharacterized protein LOC105663672 n=1 Tax=Megachile rotundata TaxID=143995 RepID=UPI000614B3FE|nr:PREDICTED: uncharacterized protein LOC105663672 [Megachile rotundata]